MALTAGQVFGNQSTVRYLKAGTTVAIAAGDLLMHDTSNGGFIKATASTAIYGPWAVAVSAMGTGGTQVKACVRGLVVATCSGAPKPGVALQASVSTAGRVTLYAARTINVTTASTEQARKLGVLVSDDESLGDGTLPVAAAAGDAVLIDLTGGTG